MAKDTEPDSLEAVNAFISLLAKERSEKSEELAKLQLTRAEIVSDLRLPERQVQTKISAIDKEAAPISAKLEELETSISTWNERRKAFLSEKKRLEADSVRDAVNGNEMLIYTLATAFNEHILAAAAIREQLIPLRSKGFGTSAGWRFFRNSDGAKEHRKDVLPLVTSRIPDLNVESLCIKIQQSDVFASWIDEEVKRQ